MANVEVGVVNSLTGEEFDVQLPDDQKIRDLIPILVEKMEAGDPPEGEDWKLVNKTPGRGFDYALDDTLAGAGTQAGDRLGLTHGTVPGQRQAR